MKTNNFLWATLATAILTLTGCSSDDNELTVPQLQDKTALLELRLIGNGINTKATGDNLPTQAEENTVKYFTVAIFNSDNTVNTLHTVTENTASATTISCTPATGRRRSHAEETAHPAAGPADGPVLHRHRLGGLRLHRPLRRDRRPQRR